MRKEYMPLAGLAAIMVLVLGGLLWLGNATIMPHTQTVDVTVPDERLPH